MQGVLLYLSEECPFLEGKVQGYSDFNCYALQRDRDHMFRKQFNFFEKLTEENGPKCKESY